MGGRKRQNLTLDLNSASPKKNKVQNLLTSPDVQMLKLTSPELEKFLSQNPTLATPTPGGFFPKSVTEEQMMYAKGFEEALEKMHQESFGPATDTRTVTAANTLYTCRCLSPTRYQITHSPGRTLGRQALMTQTPTSFQREILKLKMNPRTAHWTEMRKKSPCCPPEHQGLVPLTWRLKKKLNWNEKD